MDIYCPKCAEPWDNDSVHEEVDARREEGRESTYRQVARQFQVKGCAALASAFGPVSCEPASDRDLTRAALASAAYELCGDDMDGASATLDDYLYMTGL